MAGAGLRPSTIRAKLGCFTRSRVRLCDAACENIDRPKFALAPPRQGSHARNLRPLRGVRLGSDLIADVSIFVPDTQMFTPQVPLPHRLHSTVLGVHHRTPFGQGVSTIILLVVACKVPPGLSAPDSLVTVQMRLGPIETFRFIESR